MGTQILIEALVNKKKIKEIKTKTNKRNDNSRFGISFNANLKIIKALIIAIKRDLMNICN